MSKVIDMMILRHFEPRNLRSTTRYPSSESVGFFLLLSLLVLTPLSEALKNILVVCLFIWWLSTGAENIFRELRSAPLYVKSFLLYSMLPIVTLFTSDLTSPGELILDIGSVKFGMLLLSVYSLSMMKKGREMSTTWVITALVLGGFLAYVLFYILIVNNKIEYVGLIGTGGGPGGQNSAALYVIIVSISAIALTWERNRILFFSGWIALAASLIFLILTKSITSIVVMACIVALWIAILFMENRYKEIVGIFGCGAISLLAFVLVIPDSNRYWNSLESEVHKKIYGENRTQYRLHIWRTALEVHEDHLLFGVGPKQFGKATSEKRIREVLDKDGRSYDHEKHKFRHYAHGHNLWVTVLVERGLVGVLLILAFVISSGCFIYRSTLHIISGKERNIRYISLAFISCAAWTRMIVGGIAADTLRFEHGMIGIAILIWSLGTLESRQYSLKNRSKKSRTVEERRPVSLN